MRERIQDEFYIKRLVVLPDERVKSATTGIWSSMASGWTPRRRILKISMVLIPTSRRAKANIPAMSTARSRGNSI